MSVQIFFRLMISKLGQNKEKKKVSLIFQCQSFMRLFFKLNLNGSKTRHQRTKNLHIGKEERERES